MTTRRVRPAWRVALAAAALASATRATAGLGERAESMAEDRKALGAEAREPVAHERYSVERMQSPANEVREFVSPAGIVFAVAWDGISHPDLSRLLGAYALEYRRAAAKPGAIGRRGRRVRTDGLVVEVMSARRTPSSPISAARAAGAARSTGGCPSSWAARSTSASRAAPRRRGRGRTWRTEQGRAPAASTRARGEG